MVSENDLICTVYKNFEAKIDRARKLTGCPLTLAEKILFSHMHEYPKSAPIRGESYVNLSPDRVAMQDATAQMALLQFMLAGKKNTVVPTTVHCDHLLTAKLGAKEDMANALKVNKEVYDFLASVSQKFGIGFWGPGSGIIHQIVLENYAFPGGMMVGTDSHTPNAGGLGMIAIGVGGADAVDVMTGISWELQWPKFIGVKLTGKLSGWASPKDVILKLAGILTVKGGTGAIIEYFGEGTETISATGKATITNMGAEVGATTSIFPFDDAMERYLKVTQRTEIAILAKDQIKNLRADDEVYRSPDRYYDRIIEINLSALEPHLVGPFTPDLDRPISAMKQEAEEKKYPVDLRVGLIGSCTNSSYEDLSRSAHVVKQALAKGLKAKSRFYISPGSEQIRATIERDGILKTFSDFGATVLTNSCGPCIGQWDRQDFRENKPNTVVTSFNRNFKGRNDGNDSTLVFIGSPELVTALTIAGRIDFNPKTDTLKNEQGLEILLDEPQGSELPSLGFESGQDNFKTSMPNPEMDVLIDPKSDRLQELVHFDVWDGKDEISDCFVLVKALGKCTTDHVSPAGKWLKYRGHLDNISNNMYLGAVNAFTKEVGKGKNILTGETEEYSQAARYYKAHRKNWVMIGDENYGEGSSREHAAMEPRHLGCRVLIAKSIARIAENNLKKQGVLVATFADSTDFDKIQEDDSITIKGLKSLKPGSALQMEVKHRNGAVDILKLKHTYSDYQIEWFKAGSALNLIRQNSDQI